MIIPSAIIEQSFEDLKQAAPMIVAAAAHTPEATACKQLVYIIILSGCVSVCLYSHYGIEQFQKQGQYALSRLIMDLIILLFLLSVGQASSARCQAGFYYQTLPLITNETATLHLQQIFKGYNLQYSLSASKSFSQYLHLNDKLRLQKKQVPDLPLTGLKGYHIPRLGNAWGNSFVAVSERSYKTFVHYGYINDNKSAPVINNYILVEQSASITCYDAVIIPSKDCIIVDCAQALQKPNQRGQIVQNVFYYFTISSKKPLGTRKTQMYQNFTSISRRSVQIYTEQIYGHMYLLRTYFQDGVNLKDNTYLQVMMLNDPFDPWVMEIIDRAYLGRQTLSIADVHIYLDRIYLADKHYGIFRLFVNTELDISLNGTYKTKGFDKISVYSSSLDDRLQIALASAYSVHLLDWSIKDEPKLVNKYSIMPNSTIAQIYIDDRFVVLQSSSQSNPQTLHSHPSSNLQYYYTWIFSRNTRSYVNSFKVIQHQSPDFLVDYNQQYSYLIIIGGEELTNYAIDDALLRICIPDDSSLLNTLQNFTIIASSSDPAEGSSISCRLTVNFTFLADNNRTLFPTGQVPSSAYTANYPGKTVIPLYQYVLGPNVTYRIRQTQEGSIDSKIYLKNQLQVNLTVTKPINYSAVTYLQTETINYGSSDTHLIFMQEADNLLRVLDCHPDRHELPVNCKEYLEDNVGGQIIHWGSTLFINKETLATHHVLAFMVDGQFNTIFIWDLVGAGRREQIDLDAGYGGNVTSLTVNGRFLYVALRYIKTIQIYDLELLFTGPWDPYPINEITHLKMYAIGLKYFSPKFVSSASSLPNVLFVQSDEQITVIDFNKEQVPKLLVKKQVVDLSITQFHFRVNLHVLIVAIPTLNKVYEYDLSRIQRRELIFLKSYPLYGMRLINGLKMHRNTLSLSDTGNVMYSLLQTEAGDKQVFIYRTNVPAMSALYANIDLKTFNRLLIDVTGDFVDYVTIITDRQLRIYRVFQTALAQFKNPPNSTQFYVQYFNIDVHSTLQLVALSIINLPTSITVNSWLRNIMMTKDLLYSGPKRLSHVNDTDWFEGNVLTIQSQCNDCPSTIRVLNHIFLQDTWIKTPLITDYEWTYAGGALLSHTRLQLLYSNGSVQKTVIFTNFPERETSQALRCLQTIIDHDNRFAVTGCMTGPQITLHLTTFLGRAPFSWTPLQSDAENMLSMSVANQLIILVDSSDNPFEKSKEGGVFIYAIDYEGDEGLFEVEFIDGEDIGVDPFYINNAVIQYTEQTQTYRLYMTQLTIGLYIVEMLYSDGHLTITTSSLVPIAELLTKQLLPRMPYDSTFQAIGIISSKYDYSTSQLTQRLIITTGRYHTIELIINIKAGQVINSKVSKLYTRYAFYEVSNYVRVSKDTLLLYQVLPNGLKGQSGAILSVYDTTAHPNISRGLIGAHMFQDSSQRVFAFNYSDTGNPFSRQWVTALQKGTQQLGKYSLHRNLTVYTEHQVETQIIYLQLINDFSLQRIRILINGSAPFPQWLLILIILLSIIGGVLLILASTYLGLFVKHRYLIGAVPSQQNRVVQSESGQRETLITDGNNSYYERDSYINS